MKIRGWIHLFLILFAVSMISFMIVINFHILAATILGGLSVLFLIVYLVLITSHWPIMEWR